MGFRMGGFRNGVSEVIRVTCSNEMKETRIRCQNTCIISACDKTNS